ncbi:unnamed protein product [Amoebophrya sp. A120]|nr:unnamed protein product [Amoebophrya sp. A120]|eukprot:GSA120T00013759001.1
MQEREGAGDGVVEATLNDVVELLPGEKKVEKQQQDASPSSSKRRTKTGYLRTPGHIKETIEDHKPEQMLIFHDGSRLPYSIYDMKKDHPDCESFADYVEKIVCNSDMVKHKTILCEQRDFLVEWNYCFENDVYGETKSSEHQIDPDYADVITKSRQLSQCVNVWLRLLKASIAKFDKNTVSVADYVKAFELDDLELAGEREQLEAPAVNEESLHILRERLAIIRESLTAIKDEAYWIFRDSSFAWINEFYYARPGLTLRETLLQRPVLFDEEKRLILAAETEETEESGTEETEENQKNVDSWSSWCDGHSSGKKASPYETKNRKNFSASPRPPDFYCKLTDSFSYGIPYDRWAVSIEYLEAKMKHLTLYGRWRLDEMSKPVTVEEIWEKLKQEQQVDLNLLNEKNGEQVGQGQGSGGTIPGSTTVVKSNRISKGFVGNYWLDQSFARRPDSSSSGGGRKHGLLKKTISVKAETVADLLGDDSGQLVPQDETTKVPQEEGAVEVQSQEILAPEVNSDQNPDRKVKAHLLQEFESSLLPQHDDELFLSPRDQEPEGEDSKKLCTTTGAADKADADGDGHNSSSAEEVDDGEEVKFPPYEKNRLYDGGNFDPSVPFLVFRVTKKHDSGSMFHSLRLAVPENFMTLGEPCSALVREPGTHAALSGQEIIKQQAGHGRLYFSTLAIPIDVASPDSLPFYVVVDNKKLLPWKCSADRWVTDERSIKHQHAARGGNYIKDKRSTTTTSCSFSEALPSGRSHAVSSYFKKGYVTEVFFDLDTGEEWQEPRNSFTIQEYCDRQFTQLKSDKDGMWESAPKHRADAVKMIGFLRQGQMCPVQVCTKNMLMSAMVYLPHVRAQESRIQRFRENWLQRVEKRNYEKNMKEAAWWHKQNGGTSCTSTSEEGNIEGTGASTTSWYDWKKGTSSRNGWEQGASGTAENDELQKEAEQHEEQDLLILDDDEEKNDAGDVDSTAAGAGSQKQKTAATTAEEKNKTRRRPVFFYLHGDQYRSKVHCPITKLPNYAYPKATAGPLKTLAEDWQWCHFHTSFDHWNNKNITFDTFEQNWKVFSLLSQAILVDPMCDYSCYWFRGPPCRCDADRFHLGIAEALAKLRNILTGGGGVSTASKYVDASKRTTTSTSTSTAPPQHDDPAAALCIPGVDLGGDPSRIYLSGVSMGGYGVLELASLWGYKNVAGILAPASSHETRAIPEAEHWFAKRMRNIPTWFLHCPGDAWCKLEETLSLIERLKKLHPRDVRLTTASKQSSREFFHFSGHSSPGYANESLAALKWLFGYRSYKNVRSSCTTSSSIKNKVSSLGVAVPHQEPPQPSVVDVEKEIAPLMYWRPSKTCYPWNGEQITNYYWKYLEEQYFDMAKYDGSDVLWKVSEPARKTITKSSAGGATGSPSPAGGREAGYGEEKPSTEKSQAKHKEAEDEEQRVDNSQRDHDDESDRRTSAKAHRMNKLLFYSPTGANTGEEQDEIEMTTSGLELVEAAAPAAAGSSRDGDKKYDLGEDVPAQGRDAGDQGHGEEEKFRFFDGVEEDDLKMLEQHVDWEGGSNSKNKTPTSSDDRAAPPTAVQNLLKSSPPVAEQLDNLFGGGTSGEGDAGPQKDVDIDILGASRESIKAELLGTTGDKNVGGRASTTTRVDVLPGTSEGKNRTQKMPNELDLASPPLQINHPGRGLSGKDDDVEDHTHTEDGLQEVDLLGGGPGEDENYATGSAAAARKKKGKKNKRTSSKSRRSSQASSVEEMAATGRKEQYDEENYASESRNRNSYLTKDDATAAAASKSRGWHHDNDQDEKNYKSAQHQENVDKGWKDDWKSKSFSSDKKENSSYENKSDKAVEWQHDKKNKNWNEKDWNYDHGKKMSDKDNNSRWEKNNDRWNKQHESKDDDKKQDYNDTYYNKQEAPSSSYTYNKTRNYDARSSPAISDRSWNSGAGSSYNQQGGGGREGGEDYKNHQWQGTTNSKEKSGYAEKKQNWSASSPGWNNKEDGEKKTSSSGAVEDMSKKWSDWKQEGTDSSWKKQDHQNENWKKDDWKKDDWKKDDWKRDDWKRDDWKKDGKDDWKSDGKADWKKDGKADWKKNGKEDWKKGGDSSWKKSNADLDDECADNFYHEKDSWKTSSYGDSKDENKPRRHQNTSSQAAGASTQDVRGDFKHEEKDDRTNHGIKRGYDRRGGGAGAPAGGDQDWKKDWSSGASWGEKRDGYDHFRKKEDKW